MHTIYVEIKSEEKLTVKKLEHALNLYIDGLIEVTEMHVVEDAKEGAKEGK